MSEFFYGVPWAGGIAGPLNYRLSVPEPAEILADADIETLPVDDAFADVGRQLQDVLPLPLSSVGKVLKTTLRADYITAAAAGPASS